MSGSGSGLLDPGLEGVEPLLQKESGEGSFGAKVVPSLKRADLSFMNSVTGSIYRAKCSNILRDIKVFYVQTPGYLSKLNQ
jgi:hypothetical protein